MVELNKTKLSFVGKGSVIAAISIALFFVGFIGSTQAEAATAPPYPNPSTACTGLYIKSPADGSTVSEYALLTLIANCLPANTAKLVWSIDEPTWVLGTGNYLQTYISGYAPIDGQDTIIVTAYQIAGFGPYGPYYTPIGSASATINVVCC